VIITIRTNDETVISIIKALSHIPSLAMEYSTNEERNWDNVDAKKIAKQFKVKPKNLQEFILGVEQAKARYSIIALIKAIRNYGYDKDSGLVPLLVAKNYVENLLSF
jgi:hypothetical protein